MFFDSFYIEILEKGWFVAIKLYSIQFVQLFNIHNGIKAELKEQLNSR